MNWGDFFRGLSESFGDGAPLLVWSILGLAGFVFVAVLFVRALKDQRDDTKRLVDALSRPLEELPRAMENHRVELREIARGQADGARMATETVTTLRALHEEMREWARSSRESDREIMRGIERIVTSTIQKMRGGEPS